MPPEPLPWERKDFFKERKHDRNESLGPVARWRDSSSSSSYHHGSRDFARWGSPDFRRPPGHAKQGGWHMFSEELGHGYVPSRSSDKILEEDSCRPSSRSGDGKYIRSTRENRGSSYSQKDWKGHSWETSNGSPGPVAARTFDDNSDRRPVDDMPTYNSHPPHTGFVNEWDQDHFKDQHDKIVVVNGMGAANQRHERENSLSSINWKPLKWTRSGSLSSRGSGYSHSSSSKSAGVDLNEAKAELQPRSVTPNQSPSGEAAACVTSAGPFDETSSRKKPRLGWGEGLAKYEKKVVGPDEGPHSTGVASPRGTDFSDCASPTTPSSVACSSSPGMENRPYVKGSNTDNDTSNLIISLDSAFQSHLEGLSLNLENLEVNTIASMGSSLIELLQSDEQAAVDSNFVRSTALNKLLIWKAEISKGLEMTESEIDSLENELKALKAESGNGCYCPATSSSLPVEGITKPCEENGVASSLLPRLAPLQLESSRDMTVEKTQFGSGAVVSVRPEAKVEDIDSPGTATSKFVEPSSSTKGALLFDTVKHVECPSNSDASTFNDGSTELFASANSKLIESTGSAPVSVNVSLCTSREDASLCDLILASNRESAYTACEVFNKLLLVGKYQSDNLGAANVSSQQNDLFIRRNFARRKRFLRFKERVITLKFRAFQHLWKEDIRLLSIRKNRVKSHKRCELSSRVSHSGFQKHRSSIRSRLYPPAGSLSPVPTTEMINFTSKLLSDSQVKLCRNTLKMPALILDKKEKVVSMFFSSNGLVEDPHAVEKERTMINPWTAEEKKIFIDNLEAFGKDFRKIASFLDHKTTADCVEFYYKNHKSDSFEKTKKKPEIKKQGKPFSANTYLLTSGKKWNREMNAASLDILGAASVIAAHADVGAGNRQTCSGRFSLGGYSEYQTPHGEDGIFEKSNNSDIMENERETAAADVLAGICGSLSSEAMSSCITSSVDPGEGYQDWKYKKGGSGRKRPLTPEVSQIIDDETCSDESCGEMDPSDWTDEEKSIFIQAISSYGKDFSKISRCVRTRSRDQCKIFFSKARKCLGLDMIHPGPGNVGTSVSDDANGGGSDTEDACIIETGSVICSSKLGCKMDEDLQLSVLNVSHDESDQEGTLSLPANLNRSEENNQTGEVDHTVSEAVENLAVDEYQMKDGPDLVLDSDNNFGIGVDCKSLMTHVQKGTVTATDTKVGRDQVTEQNTSEVVSVSSEEPTDRFPSGSDTMVQTKSFAAESVDCDQTEGRGGEMVLAENGDVEEENINADTIGERSLPSSLLDTMNENAPLVALSTRPCTGLTVRANSQHHTPMELESNQKPLSISRRNSLPTEASVSKDAAVVQIDKTLTQDVLSSTLGLEEIRNKQCQRSISMDDHYQHLSGHPISNHVESSQILRGYPLQISTKKDVNGDIFGRKTSAASSLRYVQKCNSSNCFLQKCNNSNSHSSVAELHLLSQNLERNNHHHHHPRAHSRSSSDPERPCNSDFKLFGQILSHPSSLQKVNCISQENDDNGTPHPKTSSNSINLKFSSHQNIDGGLALSKFDRNNYLGLENFAMRTYGFWDGNRIQTGFSAVPDSALLRATYPAAFSNYPSSSTKLEQQALQAVVKSNGGTLNGASVFPTLESSGNGVTDYQVYRSRDGNKLLPMMQQRQDLLSEMQRLNGYDGVSSLQQQGRGIVGMNVVGRAGILVGGSCPAVSDPVAAIKMHYAKAEQYGGQTGSIMAEEESWRCKGDIGR